MCRCYPLLSRCFRCCYAAVISLFSSGPDRKKIELLHEIRRILDGDFEPEQRVAACGAGPASIVAVADTEPANFQQMQVKRTAAG